MTAKSPTAEDASQIQNRKDNSVPLKKPLLRHKEDLRQLACTALFFGVFAWTWANFSSPLSGGLISFASWLALAQLSFMGAVATHNAIHTPLFWSRSWNSFYQVCLSLQYGFPVSVFIPGHNLSHHKHTQQARDFMRTTKVHYRWHFLNGLLFFWHVVLTSPDDEKLYFAVQARKNRPIARQRRIEQVVVVGAAVMLVLLSWRRFIWFALLPQLYAKYCLVTLNLLQHDGCDNASDVNFARNFTGTTLNYLCFNNGYHTIHHRFPGMHWSVLPQKHQELIAPHIAPSLVEPSILGYIWRTFVWPGVRLDWRGKPLVITQEEKEMKDLPWNYNQDESYSIKSDEY